MRIEVLIIFCSITATYAYHTKKWKTPSQPRRNKFNSESFLFDFMNSLGDVFNIKVPKLKIPRYDFNNIRPGEAQVLRDGPSRGVAFRSRNGNSGGFAFSSGGGMGFSMVGDGSPSGNILMGSDGKTGEVFVRRTRPAPFFGSNGLFTKLLKNL